LAGSRLSAYFWDEEDRKVWYVAAYSAFSHRCDEGGTSTRDSVGGA
jgi:hypothetical protein